MMPVIPADKANHAVYGLAVGAVVTVAAILVGLPYIPVYSVVAAAAIGVAKEVYDKVSGKGFASGMDAVATTLGGVPVSVILGIL
jgi:hypothetical protein